MPKLELLPAEESSATGKSNIRGFTIVELLVVMGIAVIMMAMAAPAFLSITRGNAVSAGSDEIANFITLAQERAITYRSHTRVVFSIPQANSTSLTVRANVSYAVLLLTNSTSSDPNNWVWIYLDRWQHLPMHCYFPTSGLPPNLTSTVPGITNGGFPVTLPGIEFKSNGIPVSPTATDITIQQGTIINDRLIVQSTNNANVLTTRVYPVTGKVKVLR